MNIFKSDATIHKLYLAGPFFNEEQRAVASLVEGLCEKAGVEYFSPRLKCCCPPDADDLQRSISFNMNKEAIRQCDIVLANIDDFDAGTMWEMGYAYSFNKKIIAYSMVPGRGLNLMLAQSCQGFLNGEENLANFLSNKGMVNWDVLKLKHEGAII